MDYAAIGYLHADRSRLRILEATRSKIAKDELAGKLRMSVDRLDAEIKGMVGRDLLKEDAGGVLITEKGTKLLGQISKQRI